MTDQEIIQAARQYEPDNDNLVELGSTEDTEASLPVALDVLRSHGADPAVIREAEALVNAR